MTPPTIDVLAELRRFTQEDPEPARCTGEHPISVQSPRSCEECRLRRNWLQRRSQRMRAIGVGFRFTDWDRLLTHLRRLHAAGMSGKEIAAAADCGHTLVDELLSPTGHSRTWVRMDIALRILEVAVPEQRLPLVPDVAGRLRRRVDATGTHRRVRAAARAGHSLVSQSRRYGWSEYAVTDWLAVDTVTVEVADAVARAFPQLIARPGGNRIAAGLAATKGWPEARYFSEANIDDPAYDPFALDHNPVGLHRMLRALAWMGHGPQQVAAFIGEDHEQVEIWLKGGPALAYATHLVEAAFDALAGAEGPDGAARERARHLRWAPPLAWYDLDIRDPKTVPCYGLPPRSKETDYPLESQVYLALAGLVPADQLVKPEKIRVVCALRRAEWSDRRIGWFLRWHTDGDLDKAQDAVGQFRRRERITVTGEWLNAPAAAEEEVDAPALAA